MFNQPIDELLGHKAVWVSAQVMPPVLDHLPLMEPQPGGMQTSHRGVKTRLLKADIDAELLVSHQEKLVTERHSDTDAVFPY